MKVIKTIETILKIIWNILVVIFIIFLTSRGLTEHDSFYITLAILIAVLCDVRFYFGESEENEC